MVMAFPKNTSHRTEIKTYMTTAANMTKEQGHETIARCVMLHCILLSEDIPKKEHI
jgi:hypothetical protein